MCHNFGSFASTLCSIGVLVLKLTDGNETLLESANHKQKIYHSKPNVIQCGGVSRCCGTLLRWVLFILILRSSVSSETKKS